MNKFKKIKKPIERIMMKQSSQENKNMKTLNSKLLNWMMPLLQLMMPLPSSKHLPIHHFSKLRDSKIHSRTLRLRSNPDLRWHQWSRPSSHWPQTKTSLIKVSLDKLLMLWMNSETLLSIPSMPKQLLKLKPKLTTKITLCN